MTYYDNRIDISCLQDLLETIACTSIPSCLLENDVRTIDLEVRDYLHSRRSNSKGTIVLDKLAERATFG